MASCTNQNSLLTDVSRNKILVNHAELRLASKITSLNLLNASSTSASLTKLKLARTYAVFLPLGKKTVPGNANTPLSRALVRIMASESPDESSSELELGDFNRSLNLEK